jgi:MoaA/NifB/PqqE/SkfB family radical SAM enzyme
MVSPFCNLRCEMCNCWRGIYDYKKTLDTEGAKKVIDILKENGVSILSLTGGEPLMRKDILEIIDYACRKLDFVRLQTNGVLLNEKIIEALITSGLDSIWLSIDGIGKTHDTIRGKEGTFKQIERNIKVLNEIKEKRRSDTPYLVTNTVVNRFNIHEIYRIASWGVAQGVKEMMFNFVGGFEKSAQFCSREKIINIKEEELKKSLKAVKALAKLSKTRVFIDPAIIRGSSYRGERNNCILLWTNLMINPYGELIPCGMLDNFPVGSLIEQSFQDVWNGAKMRYFRREVLRGMDVCRTCCVSRVTLRERLRDFTDMERVVANMLQIKIPWRKRK